MCVSPDKIWASGDAICPEWEGVWHIDPSVVGGVPWATQYVRMDRYNALLKAANSLASLHEEECDIGTEFETVWDVKVHEAIIAYNKAKETK